MTTVYHGVPFQRTGDDHTDRNKTDHGINDDAGCAEDRK